MGGRAGGRAYEPFNAGQGHPGVDNKGTRGVRYIYVYIYIIAM